ncbi:MAG: hypothetical protein O3B27_04280 [Actinomycetota bacterium]|nr:hypothetical protein [Actinomycetota bacterium]MDA2950557.1 hypothetical protein [Actinomycetota bacterium]MDA2990761.1 hypothetical protein [Actinomycetota bacterium]
MKKSLARGVGVIGSAAMAVVLFGAGSASAVDEYKGLTYEQVLQYTSNVKVASRVGEDLPTAQCIVTGSRNSSSLDSSGNYRGGLLLDLNCNDPMTEYSVMTPQGKEAQALKETGKDISTNYAQSLEAGQPSWCEENGDRCWDFCERSGTCSDEVLEFLGQ